MGHVTEEKIHELAAGYVLDALDPEERRVFESHLESCARCQEEVATLGDAATGLAFATDGALPAPELRERLLESARGERTSVAPLHRRRWTPAWTAAAAAAACLAIGLGLWATLGGSSGSRAREPQTLALPGNRGSLEVGRTGKATLVVDRIRAAPSGKLYEVWVIGADAPRPAGVFRQGGSRVELERRVPPGSTVAVTVESHRVASPTSSPVFTVRVPA
jgi:anti-sigma-K factor RskA